MSQPETMESMIYNIKIDLASVKNDITWLKRLFTGCVILVGAIFGVDVSGVVA